MLRGAEEEISSFQQRVGMAVDAFAKKHGLSCRAGDALPVVKRCSARGPRFLELHRSQTSFTVVFDQPYPGGLLSKAPQEYVVASEDLERDLKLEFGGAVIVVSK